MGLPVRTDRSPSAGLDHVHHAQCDQGEGVVGGGPLPATAQVRDDLAPWEPFALLRVQPHLVLGEEELLVPGTDAAHYESG